MHKAALSSDAFAISAICSADAGTGGTSFTVSSVTLLITWIPARDAKVCDALRSVARSFYNICSSPVTSLWEVTTVCLLYNHGSLSPG